MAGPNICLYKQGFWKTKKRRRKGEKRGREMVWGWTPAWEEGVLGTFPWAWLKDIFKKRAAEAGCVSFCTMCSSLFPCSLESRLFLATYTCISRHSDKVIHGSLVDTGAPKKIAFFLYAEQTDPSFRFGDLCRHTGYPCSPFHPQMLFTIFSQRRVWRPE